jgi:hypothetical protein
VISCRLNLSNHQAKEIGTRYKSLSEEEMAKWTGKAEKAKEVYKKEMEEYEKTKPIESPKKSKGKAKKTTKEPEPSDSDVSEESEADSDSDSD